MRRDPAVAAYRWGTAFFAAAALHCLAVLPYAIRCCSRFPDEGIDAKPRHWADGDPSVTQALLDWPPGFRILLLTLVAALLCLLATGVSLWIAQRSKTTDARMWSIIVRGALACFSVGVLYILADWVQSFFGYLGPAALTWMLGIPTVIAVMERPRLASLLLIPPLALGGWVCMILISLTAGIPLD